MLDAVPERTLDLPTSDKVATPAAPPATIGHFRITRELGAGGMGVVFEAYDIDLDRDVAIKVLHDRQAGHRLLDEAQAMARLAHPNVIGVYEVGTVVDQTYIVMELVRGGTLASWLAEPRTAAEIVHAFVQAGNGLVAAHDAGLVHGDFKPNNVLVDEADRVRVADFGLARHDHVQPRLAAGSRPVVGTPGYMAPEQLAGEHVDARADQYAFAVALRQALQGHRVSRRIRRAIDRGLSPDAIHRFPTLAALLAELGTSKTRRRAVFATVAFAGASAAVATALTWSATPEHRRDDCLDGVSLVDGAWTAAARTRALEAGGTTASLLDDWAASWRLARRTACVAEPEVRPARIACLDGRLAELRAQLAVWARGDRDILARSYSAAAALPMPESCAEQRTAPGPISTVVIERVAMVEALARAGRSAEAHPLVAPLLNDARASGDPATLSSAYAAAGHVERDLAAFDVASAHFANAAREARRAGDNAKLINSMISQATIATDRGHPLEAIGILDAAAAMTTTDDPALTPLRRSELMLARGDALTQAGRLPEALVEVRRAVAMLEPMAQREPKLRIRLATALAGLAAAESLNLHHVAAHDLLVRTLAIEETEYGPRHPEVAKTLHDLANTEGRMNDFDGSIAHYNRARTILAGAYGENHHMVALTDFSLGNLELQRNRPAPARSFYDRALAELVASVGPDHPDVARIEGAIGYIDREGDRCRESVMHSERAIAIVERSGIRGIDYATYLTNLAACLIELQRDSEARPHLERALGELARIDVPQADRSEANAHLAEIAWRAGDRPRAFTLATEVLAMTAGQPEPYATLHAYMTQTLAGWKRQTR
ncbi:MAG: serine/threonine-protein kinase [Kofleriaceae bacterium]